MELPLITVENQLNASLADKTVVIAHTNAMPAGRKEELSILETSLCIFYVFHFHLSLGGVRQASIFTSITIAEYFRDMGYDVLLSAKSASRWALALKELSLAMGELPGNKQSITHRKKK